MKQYPRGYYNYRQDDWVELLSLAEFAYKDTISTDTGMTPFFGKYSFNMLMDLDAAPGQPPLNAEVLDFRDCMTKLDQHLEAKLKLYNHSKSNMPISPFYLHQSLKSVTLFG
jgi:hypothetical protein